MYDQLKSWVLKAARLMGLFALARKLTAKKLRILCYHNFLTEGDAAQWKPKLFISAKRLEKRMDYLQKAGYSVLPLSECSALFQGRSLPDLPVAITIDDGWYGVKAYAHPVFKTYEVPYTLYVASYHSQKESMVFNLAVSYICWRTRLQKLNLGRLGIPGNATIDLGSFQQREDAAAVITEYGREHLIDEERTRFLQELCNLLAVDWEAMCSSRNFHIMTREEILEIHNTGADIQLHTHRHKWPLEREDALKELEDNKSYLESFIGKPLKHFCYPSGFWHPSQLAILEDFGIQTATTCEAGLNDNTTPPLLLNRFLDSDTISQIVFEAEMSGFMELARQLKRIWKKG